jgi:glycyl-tRNA synthetase alpha chain
MNFQDLLLRLQEFWRDQGCVLEQPFDIEVGAGTFHPATFFGVLGGRPWNVAYVQPSRRPADGRYGDNPIRMQFYYQYQVILKPSPDDVQELYLRSLEELGVNLREHDVRFEKDDWKSPTLGASGLGWQVVLDGLEISQFTYFQQVGGIELDPISCELTYGTERIAMMIQNVETVWDLRWNDELSYGELRLPPEREGSRYNFEAADVPSLLKLFEIHEREAKRLLKEELVFPAYEHVAKCSHLFNMLDARRAISTTERERFIRRVQDLACRCAREYIAIGNQRSAVSDKQTAAGLTENQQLIAES